jgi:hypothetical protein
LGKNKTNLGCGKKTLARFPSKESARVEFLLIEAIFVLGNVKFGLRDPDFA